jgi:hypothetical protein
LKKIPAARIKRAKFARIFASFGFSCYIGVHSVSIWPFGHPGEEKQFPDAFEAFKFLVNR